MKKLIVLILTLMFVLGMVSCSDEDGSSNSSVQDVAEQADQFVDEAVSLEKTFPVENAKRAAVVALTNAVAADIFSEDGNTFDISKFHSYADTSGEYLTIVFKGDWTAKDQSSWHVDNLKLKTVFGLYILASLDVHYDGTNYIVSNLSGTMGNEGVSAEYHLDISEFETGFQDVSYLTVSPELIADDRVS